MTKPNVSIGPLTIWLPTASDPRFSIFEDLAELMHVETSRDAALQLDAAWRASGRSERLDVDYESDFVSVSAGRKAIVAVARLILELIPPAHRPEVSTDSLERANSVVARHVRPRAAPWNTGDVFRFELADGTFGFGQVLWRDGDASSRRVWGPVCALFNRRTLDSAASVDVVVRSRIVTILNVSGDALDDRTWTVIGRRPPATDPFGGPCGKPGDVGSRSWDGLEVLANAWFGLRPWNDFHDEDDLDQWLMPGVQRPPGVVLLSEDERAVLRAARAR